MVSPEDFLSGKAQAPSSPDGLKVLVGSLVSGCRFLAGTNSANELALQQRTLLKKR